MKSRPRIEKISDEMREWSTLLAEELQRWPEVTSRRMFGMTVFYHKGTIFAALPRTRCFETPNSVAFKLYRMAAKTIRRLRKNPWIALPANRETGWISIEIQDSRDLETALEWFLEAYESSGGRPKVR